MKLRSFRLVGPALLPLALAACMSPGPAAANSYASAAVPLGVDLGGAPARPTRGDEVEVAGGTMPGTTPNKTKPPSAMQLAHEGHEDAHAIGTVTAVNIAQRKLGVSHEPISALGWPAMTMEFAVAPAVDLNAVKPGARVNFTLEKGADGMYVIQSVQPAGGGR